MSRLSGTYQRVEAPPPGDIPRLSTPVHTQDSLTGIPNTLPPQNKNGVLELGRVGVSARDQKTAPPGRTTKTGIYNTLQQKGQSQKQRQRPVVSGRQNRSIVGRCSCVLPASVGLFSSCRKFLLLTRCARGPGARGTASLRAARRRRRTRGRGCGPRGRGIGRGNGRR